MRFNLIILNNLAPGLHSGGHHHREERKAQTLHVGDRQRRIPQSGDSWKFSARGRILRNYYKNPPWPYGSLHGVILEMSRRIWPQVEKFKEARNRRIHLCPSPKHEVHKAQMLHALLSLSLALFIFMSVFIQTLRAFRRTGSEDWTRRGTRHSCLTFRGLANHCKSRWLAWV